MSFKKIIWYIKQIYFKLKKSQINITIINGQKSNLLINLFQIRDQTYQEVKKNKSKKN